ncbi:MAG: amino acid adenylation domain-containing protein, partial [Chloroflexota bacterium]
MTQEIVPQKIGPSKTVSHFMKPQTAQHPSPMTEQTLDMLAISSHLPQVGSLTQESHDIDTCIHNLFESQVGRTPDAIAIYFEDTHLTYLQLNEYANQLAHYLRAVDPDIGPSTFVGIHLDRSLGMLASILAVLKIGAAYLPLDPALPPARLDYILSNTQPSVLLSHTDYADQLSAQTLAGFTHQIVCMDQLDTHLHGYATLNPASMVSPDELAYILYTSGSTGNPKGVEISHKTVINFLNSMQIRPGITDKDVMLALTTLSFDIAVLELFLPLTVGASLVLAPTAAARDAEQLQALIAGENTGVAVTIMQATPATWRMLLAMGWRGQTGLTMLCGGEAMPVALAEQLQTCGDVLWNLYGPTETTIWSTIYRVYPPEAALALPSELFNSHTVPIGYPIANTQIYVVDDTLQPVPNGTEGELLIGGAGLARGYHKRPDITAERFIDNP